VAGVLVGYLNSSESNKLKMFQLGLAVPSLLTAIYTGQDLQSAKANHEAEINSHIGPQINFVPEVKEFSFPFITSAYAQRPLVERRVYKKFVLPQQTLQQSLWQGVSGSSPENIWYVIASSHKEEKDARSKAEEINRMGRTIKAEVYSPNKENPYYSVVIGANLTLNKAKELQQKAINEGISKEAYLWSLK
jgi:hypothetical protein